jgi:hypothetical protein
MKPKRHNLFTRALNAATRTLNAAYGVFQELSVPDGAESIRFRLSPYGDFPVKDVTGRDIIQVVDREAGQTMAANFSSLSGQVATFFRGVPVYEGHADDEDWLKKNPGHRASAVARIKAIETADDGIYVTASLNSSGIDLLGGDAPKYTGHSPHWRVTPIPGRPGHYRPILLWSTALTNTPNIIQNSIALNALQGVCDDDAEAMQGQQESPDSGQSGADTENQDQQTDMKLTTEALAALGFAPEAEPTPDEISAAIVKMLGEKAEAEAKMATAEGETTAANSRARQARTELEAIRSAAVTTVVERAVAEGRITEADRPAWTTALNTSFVTEAEKLSKLMPMLNTANHMAGAVRRDLAPTDAMNSAARITEAVTAHAVEKNIDISTAAGWTRAFESCRAARPELFAK